jgi:hypothetical protein
MPEDFYKRTATFKGLSLNDNIGILTGSDFPWNAYTNVPLGSRYFKQDGTEYKKIGTGNTSLDWVIDYTVLTAPSVGFTKQYVHSFATTSTGLTTDVTVATLAATGLTIGVTYLVTYEGIINTPKSGEYAVVSTYSGSTLLTSTTYDTNSDFQNIPMSLSIPVVATATAQSFSLRIRSSNATKIVSVTKPFILIEGL